jgi:thiosulfate reductase cytochrome b subunit
MSDTTTEEPKAIAAIPVERFLQKKHPLAIRWFHWLNFPVLFLMIWSGLMIYWANRVFLPNLKIFGHSIGPLFPDSWYAFDAPRWWPHWLGWMLTPGTDDNGVAHHYLWNLSFRLAEGMSWHFTFAWIFAINGIAYVLYLIVSGSWRELLPKPAAFKEAILVVLHDLYLYRKPLPIRKYNAAQQIAYTGVIFMGALMLFTGLAIYKPSEQSWAAHLVGWWAAKPGGEVGVTPYSVARFLHFWTTMAFLGFFLVHVGQVVKTGWNNFRAMVTGYELADIEVIEP